MAKSHEAALFNHFTNGEEDLNTPIVSFRDFGFQYTAQAEPTLHHINLDIFPGEKILIAGVSGSGKSTLGNCINGLIPFAYPGEDYGRAYCRR